MGDNCKRVGPGSMGHWRVSGSRSLQVIVLLLLVGSLVNVRPVPSLEAAQQEGTTAAAGKPSKAEPSEARQNHHGINGLVVVAVWFGIFAASWASGTALGAPGPLISRTRSPTLWWLDLLGTRQSLRPPATAQSMRPMLR